MYCSASAPLPCFAGAPAALFCSWCSTAGSRPPAFHASHLLSLLLFIVAAAIYYIKLFSFVSCSISINPSPHIFLQFIEVVRVHNSVSQPISSLFYD